MSETSHVRFISTNKAVCEKPSTLGYDTVIVDYTAGETCPQCLGLIMAFNDRIDRYDLTLATVPPHRKHRAEDPLAPFRGLLHGVVIASSFWITVFVIAFFVWGD